MSRQAAIIASTLLVAIIASASFYSATEIPVFREVLFWQQLWGSSSEGMGSAMKRPARAYGEWRHLMNVDCVGAYWFEKSDSTR